MKRILALAALLFLLASCNKDEDDNAAAIEDITNRLNFIIEDNQSNFGSFSSGLSRTAYKYMLSDPGPYTIMLPDNNAFIDAGYPTPNDVLTESASVLNNIISYHITHGRWELNKLPFRFNQEIESISGRKMYVTRWIKNQDTVVTINGTRVLNYNMQASNGLIQVLNAVLQPLVHSTLSDAIAADANLTYLNAAIQRAGMKTLLASAEQTFTVFAPGNEAFVSAGYATIQDINNADPAVIRRLLEYTMFSGRKFIYDYVLTTDATDKTEQRMVSGSNVAVTLVKTLGIYTGINIRGIGNSSDGALTKTNVLAGNGVLHVINLVLKETL